MNVELWLGIIAIIIAIAVPTILEYYRRPSLVIAMPNPPDPLEPTDRNYKIIHARVINKPLGKISKIIHRSPAVDARIIMRFIQNNRIIFNPIGAKWDVGPEPVLITLAPNGQPFNLFYGSLIPSGERISIAASLLGEAFAVAVKHRGDPNCYAFNGWSYQPYYPPWCNPDWRLSVGTYDVQIQVFAGEATAERTFRLHNLGTKLRDFRLEIIDSENF